MSIHRHDGFHMFSKTKSPAPEPHASAGFEKVTYELPTIIAAAEGGAQPTLLRVLERQAGAKFSLSELASSIGKDHGAGVDNTGNVRVWPAEEVLLFLLLESCRRCGANIPGETGAPGEKTSSGCHSLLSPAFFERGSRRVLELGGGMTALAGLGLSAAVCSFTVSSSSEGRGPSVVPLISHLTLTDGNPSSVATQRAAAALNRSTLGAEVVAEPLFWELGDEGGTEARLKRALRAAKLTPWGSGIAGGGGLELSSGDEAEALWKMGRKWYRVTVREKNQDGTYDLLYEDGDKWDAVPADRVRRLGCAPAALLPPPTPPQSVAVASDGDGAAPEGTLGDLEEDLRYDLILGADLLFFESHAALAAALDRLLSHGPAAVALLAQPSRGGTMEAFSLHPEVLRRFRVEHWGCGELDPGLLSRHREYGADTSYTADIHYPHVLRLSRVAT